MRALVVTGGFLSVIVAIACGSSGIPCIDVEDCILQNNSCPAGQELFCNFEEGAVCDCAGGSGGAGGTGGAGGMGGTGGGAESCVLSNECNPFEIYDCDTPCQGFCGSSGTEAYGDCGTNVDPSMPPPGGVYNCVCHCGDEQCP